MTHTPRLSRPTAPVRRLRAGDRPGGPDTTSPGARRAAGPAAPAVARVLRRLRAVPLAALALVAALVAACSGGGSSPAASSGGGSPSASASASANASSGGSLGGSAGSLKLQAPTSAAEAGCQVAAAKRTAPGASLHTVKSGGAIRSFLLAVPSSARTSNLPLPLVIDYHGYHQTALQQEQYTKLGQTGMSNGYVVITPQGVKGQWNFVRRAAAGPDDVAFTKTVLATVDKGLCIDQNRIFATGLSDGADMADTVACALPGTIAAVVPVAPSVAVGNCAGKLPSYLEIHGTADPVVPYGGGGPDRAAPFQGTRAQPTETRVKTWARLAGCGATSVWRTSTPHTRYLSFPGCPGRDVGLLAVAGGGHTWPGAAARPSLGATTDEVSADEVMLLFFKGHPRST